MSKISRAMDKAERESVRETVSHPGRGPFTDESPVARETAADAVTVGDAVTARRVPPRTIAPQTPESCVEAYQTLASEDYLALPDPRSRVIMVTSAVDGEGTSTVSREFAETLALTNEVDTLLVDANLRKPSHHRTFRAQEAPGLTDVVLGGVTADDGIQTTSVPHLSLITAGRRVVAPPRVFADPTLPDLIGSIRRRFQMTVIDMPPVLSFSEGVQLSRHVDGVLLVIRAGRTKRQLIELAAAQLEDAGANVVGAVLNRRRFHIPRMIYERL